MTKITHAKMVAGLAKRGEEIIHELTPLSIHLLHMAVGISGEAGELCQVLYGISNFDEINIENVIEELGDLEFYLEGFRQGLQLKLKDTIGSSNVRLDSLDIITVKDKAVLLNIETSILLDFIKKHVFYVKPIKLDLVIASLIKINNYMFIIRSKFYIEYQETIDHNITKLGERYKGHNYSNEQAIERADKA